MALAVAGLGSRRTSPRALGVAARGELCWLGLGVVVLVVAVPNPNPHSTVFEFGVELNPA